MAGGTRPGGTVLVTGGGGFLGRRLVTALVERGAPCRVLVRREAAAVPSGVEVVVGDLSDAAALARAVAGVATVVHAAAAIVAPPEELERSNVAGSSALGRAARAAGVARFIHVSSAAVYAVDDERPHDERTPPRPATAYGASKLGAEEALRLALAGSAVGWVILRPTGIYGPGGLGAAALYRQVRRRRLWLYGPTPVVVHPVHVDDVVQAILLVLDRPELAGEVFDIAGERPLEHAELVREVARRLGVRRLTLRLPRAVALALVAPARLGFGLAGRTLPWRLERLARRRADQSADCARARRVLGYRPRPLADGLDEAVAWARSEGLL